MHNHLVFDCASCLRCTCRKSSGFKRYSAYEHARPTKFTVPKVFSSLVHVLPNAPKRPNANEAENKEKISSNVCWFTSSNMGIELQNEFHEFFLCFFLDLTLFHDSSNNLNVQLPLLMTLTLILHTKLQQANKLHISLL